MCEKQEVGNRLPVVVGTQSVRQTFEVSLLSLVFGLQGSGVRTCSTCVGDVEKRSVAFQEQFISPWLPQQPEGTLFHFLLPEQNQQKVQHQPVVSIHRNHLRQFIHVGEPQEVAI